MNSPEEPAQRDVLSSLPRTRPQRRSAKRDGGSAPKRAAAKRPPAKAQAKSPTGTRRKGATSKVSSGAAKPRATAPKAPSPEAATSPPPRSVEPPSRTDVLAGAAEAAGELVKAGLAVGGELVRGALSRLPRP